MRLKKEGEKLANFYALAGEKEGMMKRVILVLGLMVLGLRVNATGVTIQESTTLELQGGTQLKLPAGSVLEVQTGATPGKLKISGGVGDSGVITHSEAGTYDIQIDGSIDAQYAKFEYMGLEGVYMQATANIINFGHINLTNGVAAGGCLLRMQCTPDTLSYINFGSGAQYNVRSLYPGPDFNYYGFFDNCTGNCGDHLDNDDGDKDPFDDHTQGYVIWLGSWATELCSFTAQAGWEEVIAQWVSEVEINTKRYRLERSLHKDSGFEPIKELPARGEGGTYSYLDEGVVPGRSYWYKLVAVGADGPLETRGPVMATPKRCEQVPFTLSQNVPNPFNRRTLIKFSVPGKRPSPDKIGIWLRVYDLSGRVVEELMSGQYSPGWYSVSWEPKGARKGVYFYRLQAGEKWLSKKLVVY